MAYRRISKRIPLMMEHPDMEMRHYIITFENVGMHFQNFYAVQFEAKKKYGKYARKSIKYKAEETLYLINKNAAQNMPNQKVASKIGQLAFGFDCR